MSAFLDKLKTILNALFKTSKSVVASAYTWILLLAVAGISAVCYGVFLLTNAGFSLIVLGTFLLLIVALIARGAANG